MLNPFEISFDSGKEILLICPLCGNEYNTTPHKFRINKKCPNCYNRRKTKDNSLGYKHPEVLNIWSDENNFSPYEVLCNSTTEVVWKCQKGKHNNYKRTVNRSFVRDFRCPECSKEILASSQLEDLTGQTFGELTVLYLNRERTNKTSNTYWVCKCSCGIEKDVLASQLKEGVVKTCGNRRVHNSGDNNPNWRNGATTENDLIRNSSEMDEWKYAVSRHCKQTCQCCGTKPQKKEAHHIFPFSLFKDRRMEVTNGILLCQNCHSSRIKGSFHNEYGTIKNTREQLEEYINRKRIELNIPFVFTYERYLAGEVLVNNEIVYSPFE